MKIVDTISPEQSEPIHIVAYAARTGATRYVWIFDAGENGYSTRSASPGCSRYQSRAFDVVARYAIAHAPGVRSCARLSDARRAARRVSL